MSSFAVFILWCLLLVVCWPLALLVILLMPLIWLITLPFRIGFHMVEAVLALVIALFFLPARLFGARTRPSGRVY